MKILKVLFFVFTATILISCQPNQEELNQIKRAEVIAVHDEVMPKIGQLKKFEKEAEKQIEILEMAETVDTLKVQEFKALAVDLNQAYEAMFVWMRQYSTEDDGKSPEEIEVYLIEQQLKVTEVNEQIKSALTKAESLLNN